MKPNVGHHCDNVNAISDENQHGDSRVARHRRKSEVPLVPMFRMSLSKATMFDSQHCEEGRHSCEGLGTALDQ